MKFSLRPIFRIVGMTTTAVGITMIPAFVVSLICREFREGIMFLLLGIATIAVGTLTVRLCSLHRREKKDLGIGDGLLTLTLCWVVLALIGSIPYLLTGVIDRPASAFFESCSGFTTTGATVLDEINHLPRGIIFWRSMTCWAGGIGILLFAIALMPALGINAQRLNAVDIHGPTLDEVTPKMITTVRGITLFYLGMTLAETILLTLSGMTVFNGLIHSMSTVSTGGFSRYDNNLEHFGGIAVPVIVMIFMILSAVNFNLYISAFRNGLRAFARDTELKAYGAIIVGSGLILTAILFFTHSSRDLVGSAVNGFFQAISLLTTTGFTTTDYRIWPQIAQMILLTLMFIGACSSSPGGGLKIARAMVTLKLIRHGISMRLHPNFFETVKMNGQGMPSDKVSGAVTVPFLYLTALFAGVFLLTFTGVAMPDAFSSGIACLCNTGTAFASGGLHSACADYPEAAKLILSIMMIGGRLELYALFVLISPKYWTRSY